MEKRRNNGTLCGKFFKTITVSSPFRAIRRVSHHHRDSGSAANPAPNPSLIDKTHHSAKNTKPVESAHQLKTRRNREAAEVVPIKFDYSGQLPSVTPREEPSSQLAQVEKVATRHRSELAQKYDHRPDNTPPTHAVDYGRQGARVPRMESNKLGANMEDEFTDYINRAGTKIRNMMSIGGGKHNSSSASGEDDSKDHFSDYINRVKSRMLRTMSSFVGGRSDSMK